MSQSGNETWRIGVVGPMHPYRGGIAHFTEMTVTGLAERGHDVRPVTFSRQYPELLFPGETQYEPDDDAPPSVRGAPRPLDSINPVSWFRTGFHLRDAAPDAVVFQYWMPFFAPAYGVVARGLRRHYGIPSFAVVHNALPHERHLGDALLSRFFLDACAGHVVMSDAVAADTRRLTGPGVQREQIAHPVYERFGEPVPNAEARTALDLPDDAPVCLFFGFVREYKGLHVLLEAMPDVLDEHPDLHLVVAGEPYDDPERYRRLIREHGLADRVHWHDEYIPSGDVPTYFGAADLVVQPYVSATQSGVAQIATHFERPMVVTDVGGLAESIPHEEAGFVVPPEAPPALATAITRFFREDWAGRLTEGVRERKRAQQPARLFEAIERLAAKHAG
ncbi:glycosyltransferase family 4 protein [Salinibacter grassmerensis]|uniref:glycosyltransferase family 4 protein n=1 Tax=Salinibacter grassmerensis TaxID=3040353 RepID=UPI0021E8EB58|nr:glycosyltransferase family 4 protein [Salinibacter grassmerensis]